MLIRQLLSLSFLTASCFSIVLAMNQTNNDFFINRIAIQLKKSSDDVKALQHLNENEIDDVKKIVYINDTESYEATLKNGDTVTVTQNSLFGNSIMCVRKFFQSNTALPMDTECFETVKKNYHSKQSKTDQAMQQTIENLYLRKVETSGKFS